MLLPSNLFFFLDCHKPIRHKGYNSGGRRLISSSYTYQKCAQACSSQSSTSYRDGMIWMWQFQEADIGKCYCVTSSIVLMDRVNGIYCKVSSYFNTAGTSKWHTTLFQRSSNIIWTLWTLDERCSDVQWLLVIINLVIIFCSV